MQESGFLHALLAEDRAQLDERIDIVGRVEEWKAFAEEGQEDDATAPIID